LVEIPTHVLGNLTLVEIESDELHHDHDVLILFIALFPFF